MGEFWNPRGQHNQKKRKKKKKKNPQNTHLTTIGSGEVTQTLTSTTSEQKLGRQAQAASSVIRVRTRPGCPEDNLRG